MRILTSGLIALFLGFTLGYFGMDLFNNTTLKEKVLSGESEADETSITLTPTPDPTVTLSPTPSPSPSPTPIPTPTLIPQPKFTPQEIHGFIERFAGQYGADANVLRHIAVCESGFNPMAINGPYAGLYQFSKNTWVRFRAEIGESPNPDLRFNAEEAVQTAAYALSNNKAYIWSSCVP